MKALDYLDKIRKEKYCSVCMKKTKVEPHHINEIGMGRNRKEKN